jgi:hypothetical protein
MSEAGGSGRYEPEKRLCGGPGMVSAGRCDECQGNSGNLTGRRKAKVLRGPLRGLMGMVCAKCLEQRAKAPA